MRNSLKIKICITIFMLILFSMTFSIALATTEDIYDVILFFGQSNMVGSSTTAAETRHLNRVETFSFETGIDSDIVNKIVNRAIMDIKLDAGIAYEYIYLPNSYPRKNELVQNNLYQITNGNWYITGETLTYSNGNVLPGDLGTNSTSYTWCVNIIPEFCIRYNKLTGHKVVAVVVAQGGKSITDFIPGSIYYNIMQKKYQAAIDFCVNNDMNVGNKFYVCFQGENEGGHPATVSPSYITSSYKQNFISIVNGMRNWDTKYKITNGAIIETGGQIGDFVLASVNAVHQAQEDLIASGYGILGSNFPYNHFVPAWNEFEQCTTSVCFENGQRVTDYGYLYAKASEAYDSNFIDTGNTSMSVDSNKIHFTAASLSQIGRETAINLAKISKNSISVPANNNTTPKPTNTVSNTYKPQTTNIKTTTLKPQTTSIKTTTSKPQTTSIKMTTSKPQTTSIKMTTSKPQTTSIKMTTPKPQTTSIRTIAPEPQTTIVRVTTNNPQTTSVNIAPQITSVISTTPSATINITPYYTVEPSITTIKPQNTQSKERYWVKASEWAIDELIKAEKLQIIPPIFYDVDFTKNITRREFAHIAVKLYDKVLGYDVRIQMIPYNPFTDTDDVEVLWAYNYGITYGTSDTTFSPDDLITREQMATMITRVLTKAGINTDVNLEIVDKFKDDYMMHEWGRTAIYYMSDLGIIKGIGNNIYDVEGNATIEQALLISLRCTERFAS